MCPITFAALGTALAGSAPIAGGIIGGSGLFAGMTTAALGFGAVSTGISLGTSLYGAKQAADQADAMNKAQSLRYNQTVKASNDALNIQYEAMADRQQQEARSASQQQQERQRAYEDAMGDVTSSAAESGVTGINLDAIRQSIDMDMGRGNIALSENLRWRQRQLQGQQAGYRATALGRQLGATPQYRAAPSRVMGPLLGTAGAGMKTLGNVAGPDWMSKASKTYSSKV